MRAKGERMGGAGQKLRGKPFCDCLWQLEFQGRQLGKVLLQMPKVPPSFKIQLLGFRKSIPPIIYRKGLMCSHLEPEVVASLCGEL